MEIFTLSLNLNISNNGTLCIHNFTLSPHLLSSTICIANKVYFLYVYPMYLNHLICSTFFTANESNKCQGWRQCIRHLLKHAPIKPQNFRKEVLKSPSNSWETSVKFYSYNTVERKYTGEVPKTVTFHKVVSYYR